MPPKLNTVTNIPLFINRAQTTVTALAEIMNFAMSHHSSDPDGWTGVISELQKILTAKDMRGLVRRDDETYPRPGFEPEDCDVFQIWKGSFVGIETYHLILRGVTGVPAHMMVNDRPFFREHPEEGDWDEDPDVVSGRPFFLAAEMWDAYFNYLRLHPEQNVVFREGFQVCIGRIFYFFDYYRRHLTLSC